METRRFILWITLSLAVWLGYTQFVLPRFLPPPAPQEEQADAENAEDSDEEPEGEPAEKNDPKAEVAAIEPEDGESDPADETAPEETPEQDKFVQGAEQTYILGSLDPESGYFLQADILSRGGVIERVQLNDPLFRELTDRDSPLTVLGSVADEKERTFDLKINAVNDALKEFGYDLTTANWKVVEGSRETDADNSEILRAIRLELAPPGSPFRLVRSYRVPRVDRFDAEARRELQAGYLIEFDLSIKNQTDSERSVEYSLVGPTGIRLENEENTRKFRDVQIGVVDEDGDVSVTPISADEIVDAEADDEQETISNPIRFAGVDVQYFAALVHPLDDQRETAYFDRVRPIVLDQNAKQHWSDVSIRFFSNPLKVAANETVTHRFSLYAGPKREALLAANLKAEEVVDYGFFALIAKMMLGILKFLHYNFHLPYGIAIICLTVLVRSLLFPLSRKQAKNMEKMKEIQPELKALQAKYKGNREKMAQAQMELFRKHGYSPLSGCLPMILQIPIFFGLYSSLYASVDLRMAEFLWIDNLAAPDHLFKMPFSLPFLGSWFNLLPLVTVGLFVVQQRMFMPPPADAEQALQYKIMNFFMIIMGFFFYKVPAGLCLYFIASSLWGIIERKLLQNHSGPTTDEGDGQPEVVVASQSRGTRVRRSEAKRRNR